MQSAHSRLSFAVIMKLLQLSGLCTFCFTTGSAFLVSQPRSASHVIRSAGDYVPAEGESKINLKVRLSFSYCLPSVATSCLFNEVHLLLCAVLLQSQKMCSVSRVMFYNTTIGLIKKSIFFCFAD